VSDLAKVLLQSDCRILENLQKSFAEFIWMKWYPEDEGIYVQFKDESENVSDIMTNSIRPIYSPPVEKVYLYLPAVVKNPR